MSCCVKNDEVKMTQIIKCIENYLHTNITSPPESQPHFIYCICILLPYTMARAVLKCPLTLCVQVKCQTLERLITATLAWWSVARIMLEGWNVQHVWDHLKKDHFCSSFKKPLLLSLGDIWKACPWNVNHRDNSMKERVEWEILQKQKFPPKKTVMKTAV